MVPSHSADSGRKPGFADSTSSVHCLTIIILRPLYVTPRVNCNDHPWWQLPSISVLIFTLNSKLRFNIYYPCLPAAEIVHFTYLPSLRPAPILPIPFMNRICLRTWKNSLLPTPPVSKWQSFIITFTFSNPPRLHVSTQIPDPFPNLLHSHQDRN